MTRRLRLVDLFAGCGGFSRGFLDLSTDRSALVEYQVVAAVEADRAAAGSYAANFGRDRLHVERIEDWRRRGDVPSADVVIGGPPCQGFSYLGRRDPADPRNVLWREYALTLDRIDPDYFVIENVAAFYRSPQWELLEREVDDGILKGFLLQPFLLNAAEFGVPQVRKRAVVVGRRRGLPPVSLPDDLRAPPYATVGEALADVPAHVDPEAIDLPEASFDLDGRELPGPFETSQLHLTRRLTELSRRRIAAVPPGGNRRDIPDELLPECWRKHKTGTMDVMGRLRLDRPSVTIRTEFVKPEKGRYLHPSQPRPITHAEAAVLQTFPLDFRWCGAKVSIARQIGNAVPPLLARGLARMIADVYESPSAARRCDLDRQQLCNASDFQRV